MIRPHVLLLLAGTAFVSAAAAGPAIYFQAHRGGLDEVPENTIPALEFAWAIPGAVPEVDIRTTKDGVPVIIHDSTPKRTTNAPPKWQDTDIRDIPLAILRQWDAGSWFDAKYAGTNVPTLDEVLELLQADATRQLYLDLKDIDSARLIAVLKERGVTDRVIFVHGDPAACRELSQAWPGARTMTWLSGDTNRIKTRFLELAANQFDGISQIQLHLRPEQDAAPGVYALDWPFIEEAAQLAQATGTTLQVRPFVFDPPALRALIDLGIHWYVADAPKALHETVVRALALGESDG